MIDIKKLNEAIGSSGWILEGTDIDTNGINSKLTIRLYGNRQKQADPEAWREDCRKRQAAGVRFEKLWYDGFWHKGECDFTGKKEEYREVPQEDLNLKPTGDRWYEMQIEQPAIGVISGFNKWDRALTEKEISDLFSGKVRPEDIPQEAPKIIEEREVEA